MEFTFYESRDMQDYEREIEKLRRDLQELTSRDVSEHEAHEYCMFLCLAKPPHRQGFWAYDEPSNMPSDCRVALAYTPTYLATAILMYCRMKYKTVRDFPDARRALKKGMLVSTWRDFMGHGYEAEEGFMDAMQIFETAGAEAFIRKYPKFCPEFTELYRRSLPIYREMEAKKG